MAVIGGSRGVGRRIVEVEIRSGACVLAVARQEGPLKQLAAEVSGVEIMALDATNDGAPARVFSEFQPDILVLCAGVFPPAAPIHEQSCRSSLVNWETDVKISFQLLQSGLSLPLPKVASVYFDFERRRSRGLTAYWRICRSERTADLRSQL